MKKKDGKIRMNIGKIFSKDKVKRMSEYIQKVRSVGVFFPAICTGMFVILILSGYTSPKVKNYDGTAAFSLKDEIGATQEESENSSMEQGKGSFDLKDGHYTGTGIGYGGDVKADVTIASKTITAIDIVSASGETDSFFERAKGVIDEILTSQSMEVDVVSGATYSSKGIISAVKNALTGEKAEGTTAAQTTGSGSTNVSTVKEDGSYKDGTYTGSAQGFGGAIKVEVTIKDGKISEIKVVKADGEGDTYLSKAKTLIQKMVKGQTTNVDTVSGATYSSAGLIKAVRNALSKAKIKKKSSSKKTTASKEESTAQDGSDSQPDKTGSVPYIDGTYEGTGSGYAGDITVSLTIKNKTITSIEVTKTSDDATFFNKAKALLSLVVKQQNTEVDVVSGATFSSEGILEAIQNALQNAKKATEAASNTSQNDQNSSSEKTTEKKEETTESTTEEKYIYKDGTYSVSVSCDPDSDYDFEKYTLKMDVKIEKDKITAISNISGGDGYDSANDFYVKRAANGTSKIKGVVTQIIQAGDASSVDVVSGATCTSKSIIEGSKKALENAKN